MNKHKNFNIKGIVTVLFLGVIVFFFLSIPVKFVYLNFFETDTVNETAENQPVKRDWSKNYPFDSKYTFDYADNTDTSNDEAKAETETEVDKTPESNKYVSAVTYLEDRIDDYSNKLLLGRMKFIELNASVNKAVGMKFFSGSDNVVVMNNGYLTYQAFEVDTTFEVQSIKWFNDYLKERDINFVYVQSPSKENRVDNQLPKGIVDNYNINSDSLLEKLKQNGINTLDLRPLLNAEFDDWYSCFFKTDHHWKPQTGVWAAGKITKYLNDKFSLGIDESLGDIDNYNIDVYKDYSLGSLGKKVALTYCGSEDCYIIYPKADASFTVEYNDEATINGTYKEALLDMVNMEKIDYYNTSTYSTYLYGDKVIVKIHNNDLNNGKRILFICDSFARCLVPCLALGVEYIDVLDIRHFNGSVINYIEKFNPDTVVVNYNPTSVSDSNKDHYSPFNFE